MKTYPHLLSCNFAAMIILAISALISVVSATSAAPGTCVADKTQMATSMGGDGNTDLGYRISISSSTYKLSTAYNITITGTNSFKGLLLYGVDSNANKKGSFTAPSGYQVMGCQALGHASAAMKSTPAMFTWTSPSTSSGNITFTGIIVGQSQNSWNILPAVTVAADSSSSNGASSRTGIHNWVAVAPATMIAIWTFMV